MGLFEQIINAIDNPQQQGNNEQLGEILNTIEQLSNNTGTSHPSTIQSALGILGSYVRSALQQKQADSGNEEVQAIVNQYGGVNANPEAVDTLFSPMLQQQLAQAIAERTGINAEMVQQLLPLLVPLVLNLLRTGTNVQAPHTGENPVLNTFLDADRDGDVDLADAVKTAFRFLGR